MASAIIHHHLGLGDHLDLNGLIRYLLRYSAYEFLYIPAKKQYYDMVYLMYKDSPSIRVIRINPTDLVDEYRQVHELVARMPYCNYVQVGHGFYPEKLEAKENENCWVYFYRQMGIPCSVRYEYFYINRSPESELKAYNELVGQDDVEYIFVHDDPTRGFSIDMSKISVGGRKVIRNDMKYTIFDFIYILEKASEIHVMESSFKSLVELVPTIKAPSFFHDFRGHPLGSISKSRWSTVSY